MDFRKISLIIFISAVIILAVGVLFYIWREQGRSRNLNTQKMDVQPAAEQPAAGSQAAAAAKTKAVPEPTEAQIQARITEKKTIINQTSKGRPYTDEELYFMSFPRAAAIKELKAGLAP